MLTSTEEIVSREIVKDADIDGGDLIKIDSFWEDDTFRSKFTKAFSEQEFLS